MDKDGRYIRQMALPEIGPAQQDVLAGAHILIVGAGGLGCAALPYLAGAGIGQITIMDEDRIDRSNLHRQTLYKDAQVGQSKAETAAAFARDLNPDIEVRAMAQHFTPESNNVTPAKAGIQQSKARTVPLALDSRLRGSDEDPHSIIKKGACDLLFDGTDNFAAKDALNTLSVETKIPLVSASVQQFRAQVGLFAGYAKAAPCYRCLFPDLPAHCPDCNTAGILGTAAGLAGLYQAHLALCFLLKIGAAQPGVILNLDLKTLRMQNLTLHKDPACPVCKTGQADISFEGDKQMTEMLTLEDLNTRDHVIVDVRTDEEIAKDPVKGAKGRIIHMEISTLPAHYKELPEDTLLAFLCAGNVRSVKAAEYLEGLGYTNICVLDKFSLPPKAA